MRWNQALTDEFGDPTPDSTDVPRWVKDGTVYSLEKANGQLALRITGDKAVG